MGRLTAGYVLVGGRSSRMGRDKAMLPFHGATLAQWIAKQVAEAAGSAMLVGNASTGIADLYPSEGPVGGILTALAHSDADWNLIVACDMPQADAPFLRRLLDAARSALTLPILDALRSAASGDRVLLRPRFGEPS